MENHIDRANAIFKTACMYSESAKLLNRSNLLLPSMVNAALAIELYLKSIYLLEFKEDFKVGEGKKKKHSHDFHDLFTKLPDTVKTPMQNCFDTIMRFRDMKDVKLLKENFEIEAKLDLISNLDLWKNVFVKVRYMFDKKGIPETMLFFPEIESVLVNAIKAKQPEWQWNIN